MFVEQRLEQMDQKMDTLIEFMRMFIPDLSSKKSVAHFLEVTNNTLNAWISEGVICEDEHYFFDDNGNMTFIPNAIVEFKAKGKRKKKTKKQDELANEVLRRMGMK